MAANMFGELFKSLRLKNGYSLREYCRLHNQDPPYISRLERGKIAPPINEDNLRRLATSVDLKPDSDEWQAFMMTARVSAGKIPDEIMSDEEVLKRLPLLFRTVDGSKIDGDKISKLIELIRKS